MNIGKFLWRAIAIVMAAAVMTLNAYGWEEKPASKRFTFSAKTKEAREYIEQAILAIENFQFGPQVRAHATKAVEADANFAFAHYLVGATFPPAEGQPHVDKALELAKSASDAERRYIEALVLVRSQKAAEGLEKLLALSRDYPEERIVQMMIGQISMNQGKLDEARAAFEKAIQLDGSTPRVYGFLGNCYLLKGDYAKARELFQKSLAKKQAGTAPFVPNYGLAYCYVYEGDVASALKVLTAYQEEYTRTGGIPNLPPVFIWNSIGRLLLENGRAEESIKAYERGYQTVPGSSLDEVEKTIWLGRLHHGRGRALSKMGKHEEAWKEAELIKKMIEDGGERGKQFWPSYHYIAGYLKLESGDYAKAIEHLKQANDNDVFHKLLLARAYEKSGDAANARKLYQEIVNSTQNNLERALAYPEAKRKLKS
ncbi:MAG: tetratricopeptide repeat protein [Acidobacteriota bacterium]